MTEPKVPQSLLSEAVEQAARAGSMWWDDLTRFAEDQAGRLASGHYGLTDLTTATVRLLRIWDRNSTNAVRTMIDNVAMLSYDGPAGGPATREVQVSVPIPAGLIIAFQVSDLVGSGGYRIAAAKVKLDPAQVPAQAAAKEVPVTVTVPSAGAPSDTYAGTISAGGGVTAAFQVAIDQIGVPLT